MLRNCSHRSRPKKHRHSGRRRRLRSRDRAREGQGWNVESLVWSSTAVELQKAANRFARPSSPFGRRPITSACPAGPAPGITSPRRREETCISCIDRYRGVSDSCTSLPRLVDRAIPPPPPQFVFFGMGREIRTTVTPMKERWYATIRVPSFATLSGGLPKA
jgi:hypothetical protein